VALHLPYYPVRLPDFDAVSIHELLASLDSLNVVVSLKLFSFCDLSEWVLIRLQRGPNPRLSKTFD
jgi:hypothetical protein